MLADLAADLSADPRRWLAPAPDGSWPLEVLLDDLPDVMFYVKDAAGRYVSINDTVRRRCGARHKGEVLGRTVAEVFTGESGVRAGEQDALTLRGGQALRDVLEVYLTADGQPIWCLTHKLPLFGEGGAVVGQVGLSRDVPPPGAGAGHADFARVAEALAHMQADYAQPLRMDALAARAGLSGDSFERLVRRACHLTPKQYLLRVRFDAAVVLLRGSDQSVAGVAHACGYADHSAFTRKFREVTGVTPRAYRARVRAGRG